MNLQREKLEAALAAQEERRRELYWAVRTRPERRRELYWAVRTRPLTDEEMSVVKAMDYRLTVGRESFSESEKKLEFLNIMKNQWEMRYLQLLHDKEEA